MDETIEAVETASAAADGGQEPVATLGMAEAVALSGRSESTIRRAIRDGRLRAAKRAGQFIIPRDALAGTFPRISVAENLTAAPAMPATAAGVTNLPARQDAGDAAVAIDLLRRALDRLAERPRRAPSAGLVMAVSMPVAAGMAVLLAAYLIARSDVREAQQAVQEALGRARAAETSRDAIQADLAAQRAAAGQDKAEIQRLAAAFAQAEKAVEAVRSEGLASRSSLERTIERLSAALAAGRTAGSDRPPADVPGGTGGVSGTPEKLDGGTPVPAAAHVEDPDPAGGETRPGDGSTVASPAGTGT